VNWVQPIEKAWKGKQELRAQVGMDLKLTWSALDIAATSKRRRKLSMLDIFAKYSTGRTELRDGRAQNDFLTAGISLETFVKSQF
jgi:hypothetical protein